MPTPPALRHRLTAQGAYHLTAISRPFVQALVGTPLAHAWQGYGSTVFLEFGDLAPGNWRKGKRGNPIGDLTLMMDDWWVEGPRPSSADPSGFYVNWQVICEEFMGTRVVAMELLGCIPEVCVTLDNGCRLGSVSQLNEEPDWALLARNPLLGSLCIREGILSVDSRGGN